MSIHMDQNTNSIIVSSGGLNDATKSGVLTFDTNGALQLPVGNTAARPSVTEGLLRYNSQLDRLEFYIAGSVTAWVGVSTSSDGDPVLMATIF